MIQALFFAHLLGDYVFQTDSLAAWKSRSIWGVIVHGSIVTLFTWLCSTLISPRWWPYALLIGGTHIVIDFGRTQFKKIGPGTTLFLFLTDQALHALVIVWTVRWTGWLAPHPAETALGAWLLQDNRLPFLIGYSLLSAPAWVLVYFVVKGTGAENKSLPGRPGERYVGMIERGLIATFVLLGQYLLVPLVLTPRLALDGRHYQAETERIGYLSELLVSAALAVLVGLILRAVT